MICPTTNAIVFAIKPKCLWDNSCDICELKFKESDIFLLNVSHLRIGRVQGRGDRDLVLGARRDVEGSLPHDGHVQVMNYCNLQTLQCIGRVKNLYLIFVISVHPNFNLNFPPTNVTRSTLNNQKTFKMSKIKSSMEKVSRLMVLILPWDLHCLHRSTHNRKIRYQRELKTRCLFLFSLLFWPCQTNSSSRCLLPKEWR